MNAPLPKLADLQIDHDYYVIGNKPINTKYGATYIVKCRLATNVDDPANDFEMFATNLIKSYIATNTPQDKFIFTVRRNSKYTYAEISGYNPGSSFILLK